MNRLEAAGKVIEIMEAAGYTCNLWQKNHSVDKEGFVPVGTHLRVYVSKTKLDGSKGEDVGHVEINGKVTPKLLKNAKLQESKLQAIEVTEMAPECPTLITADEWYQRQQKTVVAVPSPSYSTEEIKQLEETAKALSREAANKGIKKEDYLPFVRAAINWLEACASRSADREDYEGLFEVGTQIDLYKKDLARLEDN